MLDATKYTDALTSVPEALESDYEASLLFALWEHRIVFFDDDEMRDHAPRMRALKEACEIDSFPSDSESRPMTGLAGWIVGLTDRGRERIHQTMIETGMETALTIAKCERKQRQEEARELRRKITQAAKYAASVYESDRGSQSDGAALYQINEAQRMAGRLMDCQAAIKTIAAREASLVAAFRGRGKRK